MTMTPLRWLDVVATCPDGLTLVNACPITGEPVTQASAIRASVARLTRAAANPPPDCVRAGYRPTDLADLTFTADMRPGAVG